MRRALFLSISLILLLILSLNIIVAQDSGGDGQSDLQVVDTDPLEGEELGLSDDITVYFDRFIDCATANGALTISPQIAGEVICNESDNQLTFSPEGDYQPATVYTLTLADTITATDGNRLAEPFSLSLETAGFLRITQVLPAPETQDVPSDAVITVIFNRPVVPLGTVDDMANLPTPLTISPTVSGQGEWLNTSIYTFTPDPAWAGGQTYEVIVDGVESVDGMTLSQTYGWTFTTESPRVIGVMPEDAAGSVGLNDSIQVTFNQPMDQASVESTFIVSRNTEETVTGAFEWADDGMGFRFTPDNSLALNSVYQVGFTAPPLALAGGVLADDGGGRISSFATVPLPAIVGTSPNDGDVDVPPYGGITLMFASPMDVDTFEDHVTIDPEPWLDPEFYFQDYNNSLTVSFPTEPSTLYTITVEPGMADIYGNTIDTPFSFTFTTSAYDPNVSLRVPGSVGFYNASRPDTSLFVTHRNVSRLNLQLYAVPLDQFARRLADQQMYDPAQDYFPSADNLLRNWQIESVAPENAVRYEFLDLGDATQGEAAVDCPGAMPSRVGVGDTAIVVTDPLPVRARTTAVDGEIVELLYKDYVMTIVDGPVCSDGLTWWGVRLRDESIAWIVEGIDGEYFIDLRAAAQDTEVTVPTDAGLGAYVDENGSLNPGIYYLEVTSPETEARDYYPGKHFMVVATANLVMHSTIDSVVIWATDVNTGQPIPTAPITLYDQTYNVVVSGITDADGVLRLDMLRANDLSIPHVAILQSEGQFGIGTNRWTDGIDPWQFGENAIFYPQQYSLYMYTDRPVYRPGQPVYYRGVVRNRDDVTYTIPDLDVVTVNVYNDQGEIITTREAPLTAYGTFSGQFDLDADASLGYYQISVVLPSEVEFQNEGGSVGFNVAEYRLPEFQVELTPDAPEVAQNDSIGVTVNSTYFFGGVVSDATVEYNVISQPYSFNYAGQGAPYTFTDFNPDAGPSEFYGTSRGVVSSGEGTTDAQGNLTIQVPAELGDATQSQTFTIEATVTDESEQAVSGRTDVVVHQGLVYAGIRFPEYIGTADEESTVEFISVDWEGNPVPDQDLTIEVYERRWSSVQEQDPSSGRTTWTYEVEDVPVTEGEVTTNADGEADYTFVPPNGGIFKVLVIARDELGNEIRASAFQWVSSGEYIAWRQQNSNRIDLVTDATDYSVGDTAEILIASPFQGASEALITVERGDVLQTERITMESNSYVYELPITADFAPNVYVSVVLVKGVDENNPVAAFRVGLTQLRVDNSQYELNIDITPDRENAGPRETVTYTVRTTDYQGQPVQTEVGVALTDLASLSIADPNSGPILLHFYGQQGLAVRTSTILTINTDQLTQTVIDTIKGGGGGFGEGGIFDIREDFVDTAFWNGSLVTDANGTATFEVTLPDNLTTWRLDARAVTSGENGRMLVGQDTFDLLSTKPLLVRPVTPRFFVVGDEVVLATVVNNNTDSAQTVGVTLEGNGILFEGETIQQVEIAAGGRARVEWRVTVQDVETIDLTFSAVTADGAYGDASKPPLGQGDDRLLPVYRYEAPETTGTGGILRDAGTRTESIVLPERFNVTQGELTINVEPSLAAMSLEALDVLRGYRVENMEMVVSRFLPNIMAFRAFNELGITSQRDLRAELNRQVQFAIQRLYAEQKVDGGWGWFVQDASNPMVTAYALIGLVEAQATGFAVDQGVISRAVQYLEGQYVQTGLNTENWRLNRQAFLLYAVARAGQPNIARTTTLFDERARLSLYARALLTRTFYLIDPNETSRIDTLISGIFANAIMSANGVHWEEDQRDYYNWNTDTRTTAMVLQALVEVQPQSELIPNVVRWLLVARSTEVWETSQETAWAVMALTDYMAISGDLRPEYSFEVDFNGDALLNADASPENATVMRRLVVDVADMLRDQANTLVFDRTAGSGVLYYTAYLNAYLPVPEIEPLNRGIIVERQYSLLEDETHTPIDSATVGQLVQVRLSIIAPNDLHYVTIEDPIPAGTDAVNPNLTTSQQIGTRPELNPEDPLSQGWGWWWFSAIQFEDERVVLNSTFLPAGTYEYVYTIRTGLAGVYNVIPATARENYFPDVYGRSEGSTFTILPGE
ncbi:MAG: Ig-like domain-containing protein [Aggregatilineales bacterium]